MKKTPNSSFQYVSKEDEKETPMPNRLQSNDGPKVYTPSNLALFPDWG